MEKETVIHLFYECPKIKKFWEHIINYCEEINYQQSIAFNMQNVMGNQITQPPSHVFNTILLISKHYIYSTKCLKKSLNIIECTRRIEKIRQYEHYYAMKTNNVKKHLKKWYVK